jgi:DNA-binding NarL/FixJ family response regulator
MTLPPRWIGPSRAAFAPRENGTSGASRRRGRLLIVEDDHLVALEIESALREAGFEVTGIASSADEAIDLARSAAPDLAVMDIRLAGERDGIDAALELFRELGIRCIFATAHHDARTRLRALPARPFGWLRKPYQSEALIRAVSDALSDMRKS